MQALLLGAGRGSRMDAERGEGPKWMLEIAGQSLAQHLINVLIQCDVTDITVARGVLGGTVLTPTVKFIDVPGTRNMLETLYAARKEIVDDVLIVYCDLLIEPRLVNAVLRSAGGAAVLVDRSWQRLFRLRAADPMSISESCVINGDLIREIGQPLRKGETPQAQYIGVMRFAHAVFRQLLSLYEVLSRQYAGRPWRNASTFEAAFLTDFLQEAIEQGVSVSAAEVDGGWIEFDTPKDLALAKTLLVDPRPDVFCFDMLQSKPTLVSSGGIVIRRTSERPSCQVLLAGGGTSGWTIPKGAVRRGEGVETAACNRVLEQTGVLAQIEGGVGTGEELTDRYGGHAWLERCYFYRFLERGNREQNQILPNCKWVTSDIARFGMKYERERLILERALTASDQ